MYLVGITTLSSFRIYMIHVYLPSDVTVVTQGNSLFTGTTTYYHVFYKHLTLTVNLKLNLWMQAHLVL